MKTLFIFLFTLLSFAKSPTDFITKSKNYRFIDFTRAFYDITFNIKNKTVKVKTQIYFDQEQDGFPIFDLIPDAKLIQINDKETSMETITSPDGETTYRSITTKVSAGSHILTVENSFSKGLKFEKDSVASAFWMSDLNDRQYLEQYIPSNIEYDQYQMTFNISVTQTDKEHKVYANGKFSNKAKNKFKIVFPQYFTSSSLFFHIVKKDRFDETSFDYISKAGKVIPVVIYKKPSWWGSNGLKSLKQNTIKILKELEEKFGAWPHPSLTIYNAGMGGMEYSGATMTSSSALGHELTHSYFARGVMPVDGNSGWIDEAIASWRDDGYKKVSEPNFSSTSMASHSIYRRYTDKRAYTQGANFMAYLNEKLKQFGGLTFFLKELHSHYTHRNITTKIFIKELKIFSGINFQKDFDKYILANKNQIKSIESIDNPYHPQLTEKELLKLL
ncbi:MAG: hypothetical protein N4A33_01480 [Bacteriovoracaceae bacterium]|jgi:hypothetical protein|nr:hypothetical protein [Bacteriovoracaceae bacterium]